MSALPQRAAVVGGGTMGAGVAAALVLASVPTVVVVRSAQAADDVHRRVRARLEAHADLGLVDAAPAAAAEGLLEVRTDLGDGGYGLVLECVVEDAAVKREVLARAEPALAGEGVLATNTSALRVDDLAPALSDPGRLVAWHWFHPADLVELVEIVPGAATRPDVTGRVREWSLALGKTPLVLWRDIPGFAANRLQYALLREAYGLVAAGVCGPADVDLAVGTGLAVRWTAVGPFAAVDLAGLDVHAAAAEALFPRLDRSTAVPELLADARRGGALGVKNGRGLLGRYPPDAARELARRRDRVLARALAADRPPQMPPPGAAPGELVAVSLAERPDLRQQLPFGPGWPEFIFHDPVARRLMPEVDRLFAGLSVALLDHGGAVVAGGWGVPLAWDGTVAGLPAGWDGALERAVAGHGGAAPADTLCAMASEVVAGHRGRGLGAAVLRALRERGAASGLTRMIAPARPTLKHRYPLIPIERYARWTDPGGAPFDPWLRTHHRVGARVLATEPAAMRITGTVAEWERWTGMALPESGDHIVPDALVPVAVDRERDVGEYLEPAVWMAYG